MAHVHPEPPPPPPPRPNYQALEKTIERALMQIRQESPPTPDLARRLGEVLLGHNKPGMGGTAAIPSAAEIEHLRNENTTLKAQIEQLTTATVHLTAAVLAQGMQ
tara:strand:+ start:236 stop:550 length:315 start_codon:yes stop_codon:yes gene_type:complete